MITCVNNCILAYPEPTDCSYYQKTGATSAKFTSGARSDLQTSEGTFTSYCDQETMGGGWTVIQRRIDGTQTFLQDLTAYDFSFGAASANFWLGNQIIRALTGMQKYQLLVEVKTNLTYAFALYDLFYTESGVNKLQIFDYQSCSTAGDSFTTAFDKPFIFDE